MEADRQNSSLRMCMYAYAARTWLQGNGIRFIGGHYTGRRSENNSLISSFQLLYEFDTNSRRVQESEGAGIILGKERCGVGRSMGLCIVLERLLGRCQKPLFIAENEIWVQSISR